MDTWVHAVLYTLTCNELLCALDWCVHSSSFTRFLEAECNAGAVGLPVADDVTSIPSPERAESIEDHMDFR